MLTLTSVTNEENTMRAFVGCYTALVTPMKKNLEMDSEGLKNLVEFQVREGIKGVLAVGTTGESPTLNWDEHEKVIDETHEHLGERCLTIAGTGSNSTKETMQATQHSCDSGIKCILMVDPYYNGPSSLEIRREYIEPVATRFPQIQIIPYVIPGRTGTQLLPQDLAILHSRFQNIRAVKEATGSIENMKMTRKLCGDDFDILSGDDDKTYAMMTSREVAANGVISVTSNVAPKAVQSMVQNILDRKMEEADKLCAALQPLFSIVTVKTDEQTPFGPVACKARNPLPYKTLMNILGMPSGPCRPPLGKMTNNGLETVLANARKVYENNPDILRPVEDFFDVDLDQRLYNERYWQGLRYD